MCYQLGHQSSLPSGFWCVHPCAQPAMRSPKRLDPVLYGSQGPKCCVRLSAPMTGGIALTQVCCLCRGLHTAVSLPVCLQLGARLQSIWWAILRHVSCPGRPDHASLPLAAHSELPCTESRNASKSLYVVCLTGPKCHAANAIGLDPRITAVVPTFDNGLYGPKVSPSAGPCLACQAAAWTLSYLSVPTGWPSVLRTRCICAAMLPCHDSIASMSRHRGEEDHTST